MVHLIVGLLSTGGTHHLIVESRLAEWAKSLISRYLVIRVCNERPVIALKDTRRAQSTKWINSEFNTSGYLFAKCNKMFGY